MNEEQRLDVARKITGIDIERATKYRLCSELAISEEEFDDMNDEEFFNQLFFYCHNTSVIIAS